MQMKYSAIIASILATMALAACEKPTVVAPPAPIVVQAPAPASQPDQNKDTPPSTTTVITVPGPQGEPGPQGPQGPQGAPGTDAPKN